MSQQLHTQYPAISDLAHKAKKRIPHFAWEYLDSGTGIEDGVQRNRQAFSDVILTPKFMQGKVEPDLRTEAPETIGSLADGMGWFQQCY